MNKYNNSFIYKIECLGGDANDIFIGSTIQPLSKRMALHRTHYKEKCDGKNVKCPSSILFDKYGIENCKISLIEQVNLNNRLELERLEQQYIKNINCVNKIQNKPIIKIENKFCICCDKSFNNWDNHINSTKHNKNVMMILTSL